MQPHKQTHTKGIRTLYIYCTVLCISSSAKSGVLGNASPARLSDMYIGAVANTQIALHRTAYASDAPAAASRTSGQLLPRQRWGRAPTGSRLSSAAAAVPQPSRRRWSRSSKASAPCLLPAARALARVQEEQRPRDCSGYCCCSAGRSTCGGCDDGLRAEEALRRRAAVAFGPVAAASS